MTDSTPHSGRLSEIHRRIEWCETWDRRQNVQFPQITNEWRNLVDDTKWLIEQLETLQRNAIRRFQVIYNQPDIEVAKRLAYDGIAEASGQEWRDLTASSPAKSQEELIAEVQRPGSSVSGESYAEALEHAPASRQEDA